MYISSAPSLIKCDNRFVILPLQSKTTLHIVLPERMLCKSVASGYYKQTCLIDNSLYNYNFEPSFFATVDYNHGVVTH